LQKAREQQAVFETAKFNFPTATWYDFRKYFTETVNGVWTTPQLVSSDGVSGDMPSLYADGGQRYFVLYSARDAASFMPSVICRARTSRAPRKTNGKHSTLLTWLG